MSAAVLSLAALIPICVAVFVWPSGNSGELRRWYTGGAVGISLWILSYAWIELARTDYEAMLASRSAFLGVFWATPCCFFLSRALVRTDPAPRWAVFSLFLLSALFVLPGTFTSAVLTGIDRSGPIPRWSYGRLAILPPAVTITVFVMSVALIVKEWRHIPWETCNRVVLASLSLLAAGPVVLGISVVMLMLLEDSSYYLVSPVVGGLAYGVSGLALLYPRVPDALASLGFVIPNARSMLLQALRRLEDSTRSQRSLDSVLGELSGLLGGRVVLSEHSGPGCLEVAGGRGAVWIAPEGWRRLYGRHDVERIRHIVERHVQPVQEATPAAGSMIGTHSGSEIRIIGDVKPVPWTVGSAVSLRAAEALVSCLQRGPAVLLLTRDDLSELVPGLSALIQMRALPVVDYPDDCDGGAAAGRSLLSRLETGDEKLIPLKIASALRMPKFEAALARSLDRGVKLFAFSPLERNRLESGGVLGGDELGRFALTWYEYPSRLDRNDDLSALTDEYLLELSILYGRRFQLTPQEREIVCGQPWYGSSTELRNFLERLLVFSKQEPN